MDIEKIHEDYRNTIINYEEKVALLEKMYHTQRRAAAKLRKALIDLSDDQEQQEKFDGLTYKEYKLVERIAVLQEDLEECKARLDCKPVDK